MYAPSRRGLFPPVRGSAPLGASPGGLRLGHPTSTASPAGSTFSPRALTICITAGLGKFAGASDCIPRLASPDGSARLHDWIPGRRSEYAHDLLDSGSPGRLR